MSKPDSITIDDVKYIRADSVIDSATKYNDMPYCIVRTQSAGVFAGYIKARNNQEVTMVKARRLWYWEGAASLSQMAMEGTSKPNSCKFPQEVTEILLLQVIEILHCTKQAQKSIESVKIWKQ